MTACRTGADEVHDLVGLGEPLVVMIPDRPGPLRSVPRFERGLAGAECNVLLGVARLGATCGLISRVGGDEFGSFVIETLRAGGVDASRVARDDERPTGLYFKELSALGAPPRVAYYRATSPSTLLAPQDIDVTYLTSASVFVTTGITALLSDSAYEAVHHALEQASRAGVTTVFDPNLRPTLWGSARAAELLPPLLEHVDIYLGGDAETSVLVGEQRSLRDLAIAVQSRGPREVVLKRGPLGVAALGSDGAWLEEPPFRDGCKDSVGAGDAFNAGYLFLRQRGAALAQALRAGSICGSAVCAGGGDFETFPRPDELAGLLGDDAADVV
jgi:sugar/nucleoside kinase (ribokinase family)